MSYQARFNFVGTPVIPKQKADTKRPFCKEMTKKDDKGKKREMLSMTFGVKESDSNMAFVEAFDSKQDVIKTMNTDNEKLDVNWDDRFDEDIVSQVASYRKYIVDLGEDHGGRQEFITVYDMIKHLQEHLPNYEGRVVVTGQFTRDWYAKKKMYFSKFRIQNVFAAPEERKSRLMITADLFYNKDSFDDSDFDENKKITLDCYIEQYINKDEGRKYVPIQVVFSGAKYDMENERHKKLLNYKLKYIKVKGKAMVHIPWEMVLLRGAEEADFDESMLTDAQKEQIELGIKTLDDFKPKAISMEIVLTSSVCLIRSWRVISLTACLRPRTRAMSLRKEFISRRRMKHWTRPKTVQRMERSLIRTMSRRSMRTKRRMTALMKMTCFN